MADRGDSTDGRPVAGAAPPRGVLVTLCVTVTVSYGVLYYAFAVLAPSITRTTGWSHAAITAAFSAGSLTGAAAGIAVGRHLQRHGPYLVMVAAAALGSLAAAGVGLAPVYPVFVACWVVAGLSTSGLFYPPAFAALTQWYGARRVRAITTLTLVAGFASTIFAPLTNALDDALGWRRTYLVLAALLLVVALPAHAVVLRRPWTAAAEHTRRRTTGDREILASRAFLLLAAAGTLTSLAMYASLVNLVPLLTDRGLSTGLAAWALGIGGAGQVAGRLGYPALTRRTSATGRAVAVIGLLAATLAALAVVPGPAALLVAVAVLSGAARGLFTLVGATLVADHWGTERYAAISGVYNAPVSAAAALAPGLGAALAAVTGGYGPLFAVLSVVAVAAAGLAALSARSPSGASALRRDAELVE